MGARTSEEPRVHDHVRLYSSASPSLKSTKGVLALPSVTERIAAGLRQHSAHRREMYHTHTSNTVEKRNTFEAKFCSPLYTPQ